MKQNQIYIIIGLMALAMIGIVALQVQQTRRAMALNEEQFNASVSQAMNEVVDRLYSESVKTKYIRVSRSRDIADQEGNFQDDMRVQVNATQIEFDGGEMPKEKPLRKLRNRDSITFVTENLEMIPEDSAFLIQGMESFVFVSKDSAFLDMQIEMPANPRMVDIINATLAGVHSSPVPIRDRVDTLQLDTILTESLASHGIEQNVEFLVEVPLYKEILYRSSQNTLNEFMNSRHKVQLYPFQQSREKVFLHLLFPNQGFVALQEVWTQALASLIFSGIILLCFWVSVRTIFRQKQLSEMKNDFINNMTHELKTPIATISLAADALNNPKVQASEGGISRYTGIIKEENSRMNRQVERVLQAAKFEKQEIQLRREEVDVHALISSAVQHTRLQVLERQGNLEMDLSATKSVLEADRVHIGNILYNLLDNANKYSPESPNIEVKTENRDGHLLIHVKDEGLGISKADLQHIFTRFYRVSTGNLHDVKGFGLGLSYVKDIVEAHHGKISVQSTLGKGSIFSIALPLA
ncbi:MAG: HAMP domain-containing sensor histidine kinase [Bacteroidota bacterium]